MCVCGYDFFCWGTCVYVYVVMNFLLGYTSIIVTTTDNHGESVVGEVPEHHGHTGTASGNS